MIENNEIEHTDKSCPSNGSDVKRLVIRAFRTAAVGQECIVFARTRGAARYATVKTANDAGYNISFVDVDFVRREKGLDDKRGTRPVGRCYNPNDFIG